jgi:uncharacterized protein YjiS (DUF1127 family)
MTRERGVLTEMTDEQIEAIVADAVAAEASAARTEAAPPSSAIVWWRAQMRARREAALLADKPIAIVHSLAIACGVGLALALVGVVIAAVRGSLGWLKDVYTGAASMVTALAASDLNGRWITLMLTAMLVSVVIVSIAAVFVLRDE